jgi:hypothetical protein
VELAKKAALLKEKKLTGEALCRKLQELVKNRCTVLATLAGQTVPSQ